MSSKKETKLALPEALEELEALLVEEVKKRQKLELEKRLGKLKKASDLIETKKRIARIMTKIQQIRSKE